MTKHLTLLLFIGLAWGQTTIAVFDFENNGLDNSEVRILTDRLQSELVKIGGYTVVERSKIDEILKEQELQISGCVEECLIEVGQMLGAKQVVLGTIGRLGEYYTVSARLVDAETSEIIRSANFDTDGSIGKMLTLGMVRLSYDLSGKEYNKNPDIVKKTKNSLEKISKNKIPTLSKNITVDQLNSLLKLSARQSITDEELNAMCIKFYNKEISKLSFYEAEELIQGISNDTFTSSKPEKNNDVIFNANTAKGNKRLVNCIITLMGLYLLSY